MSLAAGRFADIVQIVSDRRAVRVEDLSSQLGVSPATVRRDLIELDRVGRLRRVHGGAVSIDGKLEERVFEDKASIAQGEKKAIAERAASFIERNDCVYLDGGSTILHLARLLLEDTSLTIVTNSLRVAMVLSGRGPRTILVGGELRRLSQTFVGTLTTSILDQLHLDKAFMGTIGISIEDGMTTTDPDEAFTKQLIIRKAQRVLLLSDSSKMGKTAFAHAGNLEDIDYLITDDKLSAAYARQLRRRNIEVICATS